MDDDWLLLVCITGMGDALVEGLRVLAGAVADLAVCTWWAVTGKRRRCPHARQRCLHGDEIIAAGFRRACCLDCGRWLEPLPALCWSTGAPHWSVDR